MEGCETEQEPCGPGDQASPWSTFAPWEDQCMREAEEAESQFNSDLEANNHRLWIHFRASACSVAQLYKGKVNLSVDARKITKLPWGTTVTGVMGREATPFCHLLSNHFPFTLHSWYFLHSHWLCCPNTYLFFTLNRSHTGLVIMVTFPSGCFECDYTVQRVSGISKITERTFPSVWYTETKQRTRIMA